MKRILGLLACIGISVSLSSCITGDKDPQPPQGEQLSSMPHNIPQSWEGTAGMPGGMGQSY